MTAITAVTAASTVACQPAGRSAPGIAATATPNPAATTPATISTCTIAATTVFGTIRQDRTPTT